MAAPVNVKIDTPTISLPNWPQEAIEWRALNAIAHGNPDFYALTVKAAYVFGVIHDLFVSVTCLLRCAVPKETTYVPALGLCMAGVDLLGRCIRGDATLSQNKANLDTGLKWLVSQNYANLDNTAIVLTTHAGGYDVETLAAMRHFAAHGQASSRATSSGQPQIGTEIDFDVLEQLRQLVRDGVERYWNALQTDGNSCNMLARANILRFRDWPVLKSWLLFEGDPPGSHPSITALLNRFDW